MAQIFTGIKDTDFQVPEPNLPYVEEERNSNNKIINKNFS